MRKVFFVFLFLLILALTLVSSVEVSLKEEVKKGENFVVKVSGNFYMPLQKENIKFYRKHLSTEMGEFELKKINEDYYFFLEIPKEKLAGNYSVVLEGIQYYKGRDISSEDISKNFTISENLVPFSISPPLLISDKDTYSVEIQNLMDS